MPKYTELENEQLIDLLLAAEDPLLTEAAERLTAAHDEIKRLETALRAAVVATGGGHA